MKKHNISTLKIAATYIGTVVGAGFATGQEILQFFAVFGIGGIWGIALTTILFIAFGFIIIEMGLFLKSESHLEILKHSGGKISVFIMDVIITFFLFGAVTAMFAGAGALFTEQFGLPSFLGCLIMAIVTAITVISGLKGVINAISFVVPFLLISVVGISLFSIFKNPPDISDGTTIANSGLVSNWFLSAILYTSYNIILSISVLGPLGAHAKDRKSVFWGATLGGLGLGLGSLMIYLSIRGNMLNIAGLEVPMIYIAGGISRAMQILFAIILMAEVYTTAVGSLYGFAARLGNRKIITVSTTVAAFFASLLGFSNLVKYLYPISGYAGIFLLICLLYSKIKRSRVSA